MEEGAGVSLAHFSIDRAVHPKTVCQACNNMGNDELSTMNCNSWHIAFVEIEDVGFGSKYGCLTSRVSGLASLAREPEQPEPLISFLSFLF